MVSLDPATNSLNLYWLNLPEGTLAGVLMLARVRVYNWLVTPDKTILRIL